jgi:alpha,alpha-trehalase
VALFRNGRFPAWFSTFALAYALAPNASSESPPVLNYIAKTWSVLTRSNRNLALAAADPKSIPDTTGRWPVFVPAGELERVREELRSQMSPEDLTKIFLRPLPPRPQLPSGHGLLYLPKPYVVPGGRFNEMYGWDSHFIQMGLLRDGEIELAKDMADNFLYEVREYGAVLNANRTYYLTRSQPPFLTQMVLAVYRRTQDRAWLTSAVPAIEAYYRYWTSDPHLTPTGLSRYFDTGNGPAPEVIASERDEKGRTHYDLAREYFRTHTIRDYDVSKYYERRQDALTELFYKGDRSMRESGFDPSSRFGPFSISIIYYNPVCLNTLLYLMETQTGEILDILDRGAEARIWDQRANKRKELINRLMWDPRDGLYYDYDFTIKRVRRYPFLTTFYPLWAGIASPQQAEQVIRNLPKFERPGGLQTSTVVSGDQWDAPFGWAPLQWIAVEGLRRYGHHEEANRISRKWLSLVMDEFQRSGTVVEKYDVVRRTSQVQQAIRFGYRTNEAGFGWTNGVFTALFDKLPAEEREALGP